MRQISTNVNLRKNSVNSSISHIMSHRIASWKCWFLRRGGNQTAVAGEKPLGARNQHQTEPCTYGGAGIG